MKKLFFLVFVLSLIIVSGAYAQENKPALLNEKSITQNTLRMTDTKEPLSPVSSPAAHPLETTSSAAPSKETFQQRLSLIKDTQKKNLVERINTQINQINAKQVSFFARDVDVLNNVYQKLATYMTSLQAKNPGVANYVSLQSNAHDAVIHAQETVQAQMAKTYTIDITDEKSLGAAASAQIKLLQQDLSTTRTTITTAKKALIDFAHALETSKATTGTSSSSGEMKINKPTPQNTLRL